MTNSLYFRGQLICPCSICKFGFRNVREYVTLNCQGFAYKINAHSDIITEGERQCGGWEVKTNVAH